MAPVPCSTISIYTPSESGCVTQGLDYSFVVPHWDESTLKMLNVEPQKQLDKSY